VLLALAGGDGMGKLEQVARALGARLGGGPAASMGGCTIVVVCGRNDALARRLRAASWAPCVLEEEGGGGAAAPAGGAAGGECRVRVAGFVSDMVSWMRAADVVVTKAGPGTISEAACAGAPCMLYDFLPGQEEANIAHVVDARMGAFQAQPDAAAAEVVAWLQDPARLEELAANVPPRQPPAPPRPPRPPRPPQRRMGGGGLMRGVAGAARRAGRRSRARRRPSLHLCWRPSTSRGPVRTARTARTLRQAGATRVAAGRKRRRSTRQGRWAAVFFRVDATLRGAGGALHSVSRQKENVRVIK